jgi:hypothetical protein
MLIILRIKTPSIQPNLTSSFLVSFTVSSVIFGPLSVGV